MGAGNAGLRSSLRAALVALAILLLVLAIVLNVIIVGRAIDKLHDFGSFAASGINARNGNNPYDPTSELIFESTFPMTGAGGRLPNLNPPFTLLFFSVLTYENVYLAANVWRVVSAILYIVTVMLLAFRYKPSLLRVIWSFALAGIWHTIGLGQIYVVLLAL
ncbi:MAG TPA: glycosyltransferase family 87 protein, partial [Anaerolineales bacterium]